MAFNFGAFAGGLSQGIQAGQKIALEQEQLESSRNKAAEAMKREEADAINRVAKNVGTHNTELTELKIKMDKAETPQEFNTYAEAINNKIDSFTKIAQTEKDSGLLPKTASSLYDNARASGIEPLETVTIKNHNNEDVTVSIPKSMAELANNKDNKDSVVLMENGKLSVGVMGTDNKIAGYQPTDISPTKFKAPEEKGTLAVIDGTPGFYTNEKLFNATKEGKIVEKSKDKPAVTNVNVNMSSGQKSATTSFEAMEILDKSKKSGSLDNNEVSKLWEVERNFLKDNATTEEKALFNSAESSVRTIEGLKEVRDMYSGLSKKGLEGGVAQDLTVGIMKYMGSGGAMSELSNITPEKFAEITGLDSRLVSQQMEIIKDLSGLSYTDSQMQMMQQITGSGKFKTNEAKINAMDGYISRIKSDTDRLISSDDTFTRKFPHLSYTLGRKVKSEKLKTEEQPKEIDKVVKQKFDGVEYDTKVNEKGETLIYDPASSKWYKMDGGK